jgi:hypothetical protein
LSLRDRFAQSPIQLEPEETFNRNLAAGGTDLLALDLKTDQIVQMTLEGQSGLGCESSKRVQTRLGSQISTY